MVSGFDHNPSTESSKNLDPDVENVKSSTETTCPAEKTGKENGVAGLLNGKEAPLDVSGGVGMDKDAKVVALDDNGAVFEDSELNGVSSLLKMQQSRGSCGLGPVLDVIAQDVKMVSEDGGEGQKDHGGTVNGELSNMDKAGSEGESADDEDDNVGSEEHEFEVGDFVWGKIKNHPWWPGRIYDPSDASDFAKKEKRGDKFLVAYFGDGTFAWCNPSQLKPFEENFVVMSRQSTSKNFVHAIEKALEEISRLVDLKMTCACVPKGNLIGFGRTLAVNAGIKEGLLVPEVGIDKFSAALFDHVQCFTAMEGMAQSTTIFNLLQFSVLKSWLSAFYRARGGHKLPVVYEAQHIPGLEDKSAKPVMDMGDHHSGSEVVKSKGPVEEESPSSSEGIESRPRHKRKYRSIAEILGLPTNAEAESKEDDLAKKETKSNEEESLAEMMKKKSGGVVISEARTVANEDEKVQKPKPPSQAKKRKIGDVINTDGKDKRDHVAKAGANSQKPASKSDGKKRKDRDEVDADAKVGSLLKTKKRSDVVAENNVSGEVEQKKIVGSGAEDNHGEASRDRRKSKYLSPPFTNVTKARKDKEIEAESRRVSSEANIRERMTKASEELIRSPLISSSGDERSQKKAFREEGVPHKKSDESGLETPKLEQNADVIDPMKVQASAGEVLSHIRSAASNLMHMKEGNSTHAVADFFSAFRSSICQEGSNHKASKCTSREKTVTQESGLGSSVKKQNQAKLRSSGRKMKHLDTKSSHSGKMASPEVEQASSTSNVKANKMESEKRASAAALLVTFGPTCILPKKNDLIRIYRKYGPLNLEETEMFIPNHLAKIAFYNSSDAEDALKGSELRNPFEKTWGVTFRLKYFSDEAKSKLIGEASGSKSSPLGKEAVNERGTEKPPACDASQLSYIQHKLKLLASMLENSGGEVAPDMKSKLEGEVKELLEVVVGMVGSSS